MGIVLGLWRQGSPPRPNIIKIVRGLVTTHQGGFNPLKFQQTNEGCGNCAGHCYPNFPINGCQECPQPADRGDAPLQSGLFPMEAHTLFAVIVKLIFQAPQHIFSPANIRKAVIPFRCVGGQISFIDLQARLVDLGFHNPLADRFNPLG